MTSDPFLTLCFATRPISIQSVGILREYCCAVKDFGVDFGVDAGNEPYTRADPLIVDVATFLYPREAGTYTKA